MLNLTFVWLYFQSMKYRLISGMNMEKFKSILDKQIPDSIKRERADFTIYTDYPTRVEAKAQFARIIETIVEAHPSRWSQWQRNIAHKDKIIKSVTEGN